jgi:hypothetical protein
LVSGWFRQTVQATIADYHDGKHRFAGTASEVSGLTASPLVGPAGTPTAFRWAMKYDAARNLTTLEYEESPKQALRIAAWAGRDGAFAYYAGEQKWQPAWPPSDSDQGKSVPQLPQLVRLSGAPRDTVPMIIAAPRASRVGPQPPPDLLGPGLFGN